MPQAWPAFVLAVKAFAAKYATAILVAKIALFVASVAYTISSAQKAKRRARQAIEDAQGIQQVVRDAVMPRAYVYGRRKVGGQLTFFHEWGTNREFVALVITMADHEVDGFEQWYLDDDAVYRDSSGAVGGKYTGRAWLHFHTGHPGQQADSVLMGQCPGLWTSAHKLEGCAYVIAIFKWDTEVFSNGLPTVSAVVRGKKLYDPRDGATRWSPNPALIAADYFTDSLIGLGRPWSSIHTDTLIESANISDEAVALASGGTEHRYEAHAYVDSSTEPEENLQPILAAMAGDMTRSSGKWYITAGAYHAPEVEITEADLYSEIQLKPRLQKRQLCNVVTATYISPTDLYAETSIPEIKNAMYLAEDNGERLPRTNRFPVVCSSTQTQRLCKIDLERTRQQGTLSVKVGAKGLVLRPGNTVTVTLPTVGYNAKVFEVSSWKLNVMPTGDGNSSLTVELGLRETHSSVWDWSAEETLFDPAPDTDLPNPFEVAPVTGLTVAGETFIQVDGSLSCVARLSWTAPADQYVLSGGRIIAEVKRHSDTAWIEAADVDGSQVSATIASVKVGDAYDFRVRCENYMHAKSTWAEALNVTITGDTTAPAAPTGLTATAGTGKLIALDWADNTEADFDEYHVYRGTANNTWSMAKVAQVASSRFIDSLVTFGTPYYYAIKAVDRSENASEFSAIASATASDVTGGGGGANTTPPSDPGQVTFVSAGTYLAGDGTVYAYMNIGIPAMPTGAAWQNLVINRSGSYEVVGQLTNAVAITSYRVDDLASGTSYELGLIAYNSDGIPSAYVVGLSFPRATPWDTTAPAVPTGLTATAGTGKMVMVKWTANTDADIFEYQIWRGTSSSTASMSLVGQAQGTFFADTGVSLGTTYYYALKACDTTDNASAFSAVVSATPSLVPGGQVDNTAPSAPGSMSRTDYGSYMSADGNICSYINFSVPAMPSGAAWQNVLCRRYGQSGWQIEAPLANTSSTTVQIDDLTPGQSYEFALQAFSQFGIPSAITTASGSPFTAQVDTTAPSAPTGGSLSKDGVKPVFYPNSLSFEFGCKVSWDPCTDKDWDHTELKATATNSDSATDTQWYGREGPSTTYIKVNSICIYNNYLWAGYVRIRHVDRTGNASAWVYLGNANNYASIGTGDVATENKATTTLTGLTVQSTTGGTRIKGRCSVNAVILAPASGIQVDFVIPLTGLAYRPDGVEGSINVTNYQCICRYNYENGSNSATQAIVTLRHADGTNISAGTAYRFQTTFFHF